MRERRERRGTARRPSLYCDGDETSKNPRSPGKDRRGAQAGVEPGDGDELANTLKIFLYKNAKAPGTLASPGARRSFSLTLTRRPNMKALLDHNSPTVNNRKNGGDDLPQWTHEVCFGRLDTWHCKANDRPILTEVRTAADFIRGLQTDTPAKQDCRKAAEIGDAKGKTAAKGKIPFWAITGKYAGDNAPQGTLAQLDFDKFGNELEAEWAKGIIARLDCALIVSYSASGRGVFAVIDTGGQYDKEALKQRYLMPVSSILKANGIAHEPDDSVLSVGLGRVEGYDPMPYIAPERVVFDVDAVQRQARIAKRDAKRAQERKDYRGFFAHPLSNIARAFCDNAPVGSIATAAALSLVGACCEVKSRVEGKTTTYGARAFCVCVQSPGAGKTTILEAIEDTLAATRKCNEYMTCKPKSDAALSDVLWECGTCEVIDTQSKKEKAVRIPIQEDKSPQNALFLIDEGGDFLKTSLANEKCGNLDAGLRAAFGDHFTPETTKKSRVEGERRQRVQANATMLLCTTPRQWIDYAAQESETDGMNRRRLIFMPDEQPDIVRTDGRAPTLAEMDAENDLADVNRDALWVQAAALSDFPKKAVFQMGAITRALTGRATQVLQNAGLPSYTWETLITNYATLCAAARCALTQCKAYEITPEDVECVTDVLAASICSARAKIAERVELRATRKYKSQAEVWGEIHDYIEKATPRTDAIARWLRNRPPIYRDTYNDMMTRGDLTLEATGKNRAKRVRLATAEEMERKEAEAEKKKAEREKSVFDGNTGKGKAYSECNDADKEARVLAYLAKLEKDNPIIEGNRNNALNKLAFELQKAGMWDAVSRGIVETIAVNAGLPAKEIKTLLRERHTA